MSGPENPTPPPETKVEKLFSPIKLIEKLLEQEENGLERFKNSKKYKKGETEFDIEMILSLNIIALQRLKDAFKEEKFEKPLPKYFENLICNTVTTSQLLVQQTGLLAGLHIDNIKILQLIDLVRNQQAKN